MPGLVITIAQRKGGAGKTTLAAQLAVAWARQGARVAVLDDPPHAETEAQIAVRAAGLVLIPVQPSPLDLWATKATLKLARDERRRPLIVLNRVPPRSGLTDRIAADLAQTGTPIAATRIGNRVAFVRAMASGLGVLESAEATAAAAEIAVLADEVRKG